MANTVNSQEVDLIPNLYENNKIRSLVDSNHGVFKYGISDNPHSYYEDPTYIGFTIEVDDQSPLFTLAPTFINNNQQYPDIKNRIELYHSFVSKFKMVFNSQEKGGEPDEKNRYVKQHYINGISGLQALTKKFIDFKEDKLTFELYEDIGLFSTYMLQAYNNLRYSYEYGRVLIPENLLYFNLYIKFSEIRNLTSIGQMISDNVDDVKVARALKRNTTSMVYKLTDCLINSYEAIPFSDNLDQAGIDANIPPESTLKFDMYFKRANFIMNTPLIDNSFVFDNSDSGLRIVKSESGLDKSNDTTNEDIEKNNQDKNKKNIYTERPQDNINAFMDNNKGASSILTVDMEDNNDSIKLRNDVLENIKKYNTDTEDTKRVRTDDNQERLNEINKKLSSGNRNNETDRLESEKTKIEKFEEGWESIRTNNNAISDFYSSKMSGLDSAIDSKMGGAIGNTTKKITNIAGNELLNALKKYQNMLNEKKNEMLNQFVNEIKEENRLLIDYNVYEDDVDPMMKPWDDFKNNAINTIVDDLMSGLKSGTNLGFL